jgi:hypothetical protein
MDPDMVRQQEEAEREALALLAKKVPGAAGNSLPGSAPPHAPLFFGNNNAVQHLGLAEASSATAAPPAGKPALPPLLAAGMDDSAFARLGRFMSFGLAGGMLGGGAGIMAANYWQLPMEQANLAIFGPAGALAMFCATASFFAGRPPPARPAEH